MALARDVLQAGDVTLRSTLVLLWACWVGSVGCAATPRSSDPQDTLTRYAAALRRGDAETAYTLLSEDAKNRIPFEHFKRTLNEKPEELEPLVAQLERPGSSVRITATVTAADGESLLLVYEDGAWKADLSAVQLYSQATPLRTLSSFVKAYEARRYDVLLRFAPVEHREGLTEALLKKAWEGEQQREMAELVAALKGVLPTARVEMQGDDRATVAYGVTGAVHLLQEDGVWKIEEF